MPILYFLAATLLIHSCSAYFEVFEFETISHEEIEPQITPMSRNSDRINLNFTAYGREYVIRLRENYEILTQNFHVISDGDDEGGNRGQSLEREAEKVDQVCRYYFSDDESVSATISICNSHQVSGLLSLNGSTLLIRHSHETEGQGEHFIYHYEEVPCPTGKCLDAGAIQKVKEFVKQRTMVIAPHVRSTNPRVTPKYVELGLVYDKAALEHIENIPGETVFGFTIKLIHAMSSVYSKLKIRISIKRLTLWEDKDMISMFDDMEDTLLSFADYNVEKFDRKEPLDASLLISGHRFIHSPGILGIALKKQTCENCELAVAVIAIGSDFDVTHVAGVASHELGHSLGFDDEFYAKREQDCFAQCKEPADHLSCIMRAVYTTASTAWSECTRHRVVEREVSHAYECLYNQPNNSFRGICGNGVTEKGEECDCLTDDSACLSCCNTTTCRLKEGAECSNELCCQTACRIDKSGRVCRPVRDQRCDIEDKCNSGSAVCIDDHKQDRTACEANKWCMNGRCEYQCLKNCYGHGNCVEGGSEWQCSCRSLYFGSYCQLKFSITLLIVTSLITFVAVFAITMLILYLITLCCKK